MWFHWERRCHCFIYWAICRKIACYDFSYSLQKCWVFEWKVEINKIQNCCSESFLRHSDSKIQDLKLLLHSKKQLYPDLLWGSQWHRGGMLQTASVTHSCGTWHAFLKSGCLVCILRSVHCFPLVLSFASFGRNTEKFSSLWHGAHLWDLTKSSFPLPFQNCPCLDTYVNPWAQPMDHLLGGYLTHPELPFLDLYFQNTKALCDL